MKSKLAKHLFLIFYLLSFIFLLVSSCEKDYSPITNGKPLPPPPAKPEITLTLVEVGLTDAYLKLGIKNIELPQPVEVTRQQDSAITVVFADSLYNPDTLLYDSTLSFGSSYNYTAYLIENGSHTAHSQPLNVTTLDTTSHNFSWEIFEFGGVHGSSVLYDVAIISPTEIWAVGEIHTAETDTFDSTGNWVPPYNAVHWDGSEWELKRIPFIGPCSAVDYPPLRTIWTIDEQAIYFSNGGSIVHFDGNNFDMDCGMNALLEGAINKMWGTDYTNLYVVGGAGTIVYYDGSSWQRIESGTTLNFEDIWGDWNLQTNEWEIITVASHLYQTFDRRIYQLIDDTAIRVSDNGIDWPLLSVWFSAGNYYYVAGSGIYEKKQLNDEQWQNGPLDITHYTIFSIRGNHINDVIACGGFGEVVHFNGINWKSYISETGINGNYKGIDFKNNLVISVGYANSQAVITVGRR